MDKGIMEKEGGFIGLGRVKLMNANAPDSVFMRTEKSNMDSLTITAKSIELISNQPENSYSIKSKNYLQKFYIIDKEAFWSQGNYLVIQKKE